MKMKNLFNVGDRVQLEIDGELIRGTVLDIYYPQKKESVKE